MCSYPAPDDDLTAIASEAFDRNRKGNIAEAAVVFHAARLGIPVFRPLLEHGRYDLVMELGGRLQRVQCKWAQRSGDVVTVRTAGARLTPAGYKRSTYGAHEIDALAAYCGGLDRCYLLPVDLVAGRTAITLRLDPTKNGQQALLHWAESYELHHAVAGAGHADQKRVAHGSLERPAGEIVVSAHRFRDRFGYYMELAHGGTSVGITRFGRPFVRLMRDAAEGAG